MKPLLTAKNYDFKKLFMVNILFYCFLFALHLQLLLITNNKLHI